jgi:hypothetical protein
MKHFTMEDVDLAKKLKPYLPKKFIIKQFAFCNLKLRQGWSLGSLIAYIENTKNFH